MKEFIKEIAADVSFQHLPRSKYFTMFVGNVRYDLKKEKYYKYKEIFDYVDREKEKRIKERNR